MKKDYFGLQVIGFDFDLLTVAGRMIFELLLKGLVLFGMCTCQRIITPSTFYILSYFLQLANNLAFFSYDKQRNLLSYLSYFYNGTFRKNYQQL
jgi:hypothetical protein